MTYALIATTQDTGTFYAGLMNVKRKTPEENATGAELPDISKETAKHRDPALLDTLQKAKVPTQDPKNRAPIVMRRLLQNSIGYLVLWSMRPS